MIRFYGPQVATLGILGETDSHHCCKVLRHKEGDIIEVIDGLGTIYVCHILLAHPKHTQVEIIDRIDAGPHWHFDLTLAVAPTKHLDRMEWLTEKITELGVTRLIPLLGDRSERRELKTDRLVKTALSAMKQSLKAVMPIIDPLTPVKQAITQASQKQRFICHCIEGQPRCTMAPLIRPGQDIMVMIGPEGDFSPSEVTLALNHGFTPVSLGDTRLRTETAALYAVSAIHTVNQLQS